MGLKNFFKKQKDAFDPLTDLTLSKLRQGYLLDHDLKTWQVTGYCRYDFGEGFITEEWELTSGSDVWYLERTEDDEVEWSFSKKIPISAIEDNVRQYIIDNDDPPNQIICKGTNYYLDESGAGHMHKEGQTTREFIYWDFVEENGDCFVTIEQWGETNIEASEGHYVEEYQFTNILPAQV